MNSILRTSRVKSALSAVVCDSSGSGTVSVDGVTITGDGSVGNPLVATAGAAGLQAANNLSDVASAITSRANLDASHDRITVTDKATGFAPRLTDFEGASLKTNPLFRCTADLTVTLDQDSTDSIPVGFTIFGMTMSGFTTTFAAGASATMETSSGGATVVASATENFVLWSATKRAANVWSVQNGRAASGSFTEVPLQGFVATYTNMPSGAAEIAAGTTGRYRSKFDFTNFTSIRCVASVSVVGATNAGFYLEYSTDQSAWTTLGAGSGGDIARIGDAIGASVSDWITIPAGMKADVWIRGMGVAGDGAADPVVGRVGFQVK